MIKNFRFFSIRIFFILLISSLFIAGCKDDDDDMEDDPIEENLKVRKNAKDLTDQEKNDYVNAILILKATPSPYSDTLSYYDSFVRFHQMAVEKTKCDTLGRGVAHMNPAFPAWHRKMLILYEDALSTVSGKPIALPYWDWTDQESTIATFSADLMGGDGDETDGYAVNDGPFRKDNWQVNLFTISPNYFGMNNDPWLTRNRAAVIQGSSKYPGYDVNLPSEIEIEKCLNISVYDMAPWDCSDSTKLNTSFRFCLEGFTDGKCPGPQAIHNIGHDWIAGFWIDPSVSLEMIPVAVQNSYCPEVIMRDTVPNNVRVGSMEPLDVSPNDPAFFMHHCNVDKLWADWQERGDNFDKYEPVIDAPEGYKLNDKMYPYSIDVWKDIPQMQQYGFTPADMIDYKKLGYKYQ